MLKNNIKKIRSNKNVTQKELAQKSKIGQSTISEIEKGTHIPRVDTAIRLARALEVTVEDLFVLR